MEVHGTAGGIDVNERLITAPPFALWEALPVGRQMTAERWCNDLVGRCNATILKYLSHSWLWGIAVFPNPWVQAIVAPSCK